MCTVYKHRYFNGGFIGFLGDLMGINGDLMGFLGDFMAFLGDLMGFLGDLLVIYSCFDGDFMVICWWFNGHTLW